MEDMDATLQPTRQIADYFGNTFDVTSRFVEETDVYLVHHDTIEVFFYQLDAENRAMELTRSRTASPDYEDWQSKVYVTKATISGTVEQVMQTQSIPDKAAR